MRRYLLAGIVAFGFATNAHAVEVDDVEIIIGNLVPTGEALADGLAETAEVFAEEQSLAATADVLLGASLLGESVLTDVVGALVDGTSQEALTLGVALIGGGLRAGIAPYVDFADDPTGQPLETVFDPDDLETIAENLDPAMEDLIDGPGGSGGLQQAAIEALQGNLYEGGLLGPTDGAVFYAVNGFAGGAQTLTMGTNYQDLAFAVLIPVLVATIAAEPVFDAYDDPFGTLFEAVEPVTEPLIDAISDF